MSRLIESVNMAPLHFLLNVFAIENELYINVQGHKAALADIVESNISERLLRVLLSRTMSMSCLATGSLPARFIRSRIFFVEYKKLNNL